MLPVGPVTAKSVFQLHAEKILAINRRYRTSLRWEIFCHPEEEAEIAAAIRASMTDAHADHPTCGDATTGSKPNGDAHPHTYGQTCAYLNASPDTASHTDLNTSAHA